MLFIVDSSPDRVNRKAKKLVFDALRRKCKDWLDRNQDNVSKWSDMSIRGLLFQRASTIKIHLSVLV